MGAEDETTQVWDFQVLDGEGRGGNNGVLGGFNHLSEVSGAGRPHDEGYGVLVVAELLSQAMLSATGSCSHAVSSSSLAFFIAIGFTVPS
ncbi:hypothetical protein HGM15179_013066 [Zosterops borbonicus]|uniref:Uncharacterized protein n=1 Tax=Zosterops borbonicus TaxID=364589 RepID=A0A8K1LHN6_9PASS|nr:hypothetical protein HGM15179_013066 [Zosterops borbonicus]